MLRLVLSLSVVCALNASPASAQLQSPEEDCGPLTASFGPFDYRIADAKTRAMVEDYHFTPEVERLDKGSTSVYAAADIAYTLKVFPNHPRALAAMVRLGAKLKSKRPPGSPFSVDCWLDRAMRFQPEDANVLAIAAFHQTKQGNHVAAIQTYRKAIEMGRDDGNLYYNLGLSLVEVKDYTAAVEAAHKARDRGFKLDGLEKKLRAAGKWN